MDHASFAGRAAACLVTGLLASLGLVFPLRAGTGPAPQEKDEAEKVARKMEKALRSAHEAAEEREALRHFEKAVAEYAELHAKQLARIGPRVPADAGRALAAQQALARAIAAKRAGARPGDIFRPGVQPLFRRLVAAQLQGPEAIDARRALLEGNPGEDEHPVPVEVRVNALYPTGAARSTMPPSVLLTLPPLPPALEYRFVGRDLILVDSVAQLIVDVLPAAAPDLAAR